MADPFSDVLRAVRLSGAVFLDARFTAPWSVGAGITPDLCAAVNWSPAQIIAYHHVIAGEMLCAVDGRAPVAVSAGQTVLLPRNDPHTLASAMGLKSVAGGELVSGALTDGFARISHGGGGAETRVFCGYLGTEGSYNPLIEALPPILKIDIAAATSRDWVESTLRFAAGELSNGRLPSSAVMTRLSETLFVEAVRHLAAEADASQTAWLNCLRDHQIGRAVAMIHRDIAKPNSTEALAREAGLSRSAFMERFAALVGTSPVRYATLWRLRAAQMHLRESNRSLAQIAAAIGYESEEAFSRAFKREFGVTPALWRAVSGAD